METSSHNADAAHGDEVTSTLVLLSLSSAVDLAGNQPSTRHLPLPNVVGHDHVGASAPAHPFRRLWCECRTLQSRGAYSCTRRSARTGRRRAPCIYVAHLWGPSKENRWMGWKGRGEDALKERCWDTSGSEAKRSLRLTRVQQIVGCLPPSQVPSLSPPLLPPGSVFLRSSFGI